MFALLVTLAALGDSAPAAPAPEQFEAERPPVRLWMSNDRRFREGDRVRVQVDADASGFLLVLNYDTDGRLRVIFPLDPRDDSRVEAGRRYEVRAENGDGAFRAGGDGTGFVYSAISAEPWRFEEITLADRWDVTRLEISRESSDPEADVTELVQRLAGPGGFDYDVLGYRVYGQATYSYNTYVYPRGPTYIYDDYLYCNNWSWRYDGCHRWPYDGGWSFGIGFYSPYYYGYYPYGYRSGFGYNYPYSYPYRPYTPVGRAPVILGRPRAYTVRPRGSFTPSAPRSGSFGSGGIGITGPGTARGPRGDVTAPSNGGRARGPARPARPADSGIDRRPASGTGPSYSAPPARRSRGGDSYNPPAARGGDRGSAPSGGYAAPPPRRSEPSGREASPPRRSEPSGREASPPRRAEPSGREAPPPRARSEPSRRDPPSQRAQPSGRSAPAPQAHGNSGGNGNTGGNGRARGRRP